MVATLTRWGRESGYFASEEDADTFHDELAFLTLNQYASFNSPVWFNCGIEAKPQCSACFINSVEDTMASILDLAKTEGMLFKWGSGTGSNLSPLRSSKERLSGGGILQNAISHSSWVFLVWIVGQFGSAAVAGYTIAIRLIMFAILPSWGLANAAATLVGQNLGAGSPDRAETSAWRSGIYNTVFLLGVAVVFVTAAEPMIRFFTAEPAVISYGVSCLRWVSYGYPAYAWGMVMVQSFNGAGDTYTPTVINLFCYWLFQLPLAFFLAHGGGFGATGAFMAIAIAETALAVVGILVFRRGKWKLRQV